MAADAMEMLEALGRDWKVKLTNFAAGSDAAEYNSRELEDPKLMGGGWELTLDDLNNENRGPGPATWVGTTLRSAVSRAWAGEPEDFLG